MYPSDQNLLQHRDSLYNFPEINAYTLIYPGLIRTTLHSVPCMSMSVHQNLATYIHVDSESDEFAVSAISTGRKQD